ncbi:MAG TPA: endonuclease III [Candidatus Dojkabacteria bacterium]|nr:endonuclease III [Candidatus Dojkabacteria bacterium]
MTPLQILSKMEELFPDAKTELKNWSTPFQFLVCIILSAQATDKGVNKVTEELFKKYPDTLSMSKASVEDISKMIKSINFFNNKAKHISLMSKKLISDFNGEVPKTSKELITLPGVGKKTANVFLNDLYKSNEGIAVDTHVARVAQRLGLTKHKDPEKISLDLEAIYPKNDWWKINSYFVLYGRYICRAKMKKTKCVFREFCSYCKDLPVDTE